ncbi:MAG TPA: hypothetical protein VHB21_22795 [Minicystis sp.]|nr:hypothetical protein [Minicystis sp.]
MEPRASGRLRVGMEVVSAEGDVLGRVHDVGSGTFDVEQGVLSRRRFSASYEQIARVEPARVVLATSSAELARMRDGGGLGTTFSERAAGAIDHARAVVEEAVDSVRFALRER